MDGFVFHVLLLETRNKFLDTLTPCILISSMHVTFVAQNVPHKMLCQSISNELILLPLNQLLINCPFKLKIKISIN